MKLKRFEIYHVCFHDFLFVHVQWNLDYLNPQFFKTPDASNQKLYPLDLLPSDFLSPSFGTPNFSNRIQFP